MEKENVYLIDLGTGTDRSLLPLASGLIYSYSQNIDEINRQYNLDILMLNKNLDDLLDEIVDPVVVGFSCYVWNFLGSVELSRLIKNRYPNTLIVWGGPSIPDYKERIGTFMRDYPWLDILVHGEGEVTFAEILKHRRQGLDFEQCPGISFRTDTIKQFKSIAQPKSPDGKLKILNLSPKSHNDLFITTSSRERIREFKILPSPFFNGIFDQLLNRYGDQIVGAIWEASRGCPFKCSFCDWGKASVTKVIYLDIDRAVEELKWVSKNKIQYVYAADANFGISFKFYLEIAEQFVEISKQNGFPNIFALNWTKNSTDRIIKIAETLYQGGVITNTTITFQSHNPPTLTAINRDNISMDVYRKLKTEYHNRKLPTYTELILGLPLETLETFADGIEKSLSSRLEDQLAIYLLTLLENTDLASSKSVKEFELESRRCAVGLNRRRFKYPRFGEETIVVGTSTMPTEDWKKAYDLTHATTSLYNLRIAFFAVAYLKEVYGIRVTSFIRFILNTVDKNPRQLPTFAKAIKHIRNNRQLILDEISSVSPVEGGDGVSLTPHEAVAFLLLNDIENTYTELGILIKTFCDSNGLTITDQELNELVLYQKIRMPVFNSPQAVYDFETNIPYIFESILDGLTPPKIQNFSTIVEILPNPHTFQTEMEFNLRRVNCGYNMSVFGVNIRKKQAI